MTNDVIITVAWKKARQSYIVRDVKCLSIYVEYALSECHQCTLPIANHKVIIVCDSLFRKQFLSLFVFHCYNQPLTNPVIRIGWWRSYCL